MKFEEFINPRIFKVGSAQEVYLKDCARISLLPDEQVTFLTEDKKEFDVTRKSWGFYATPSTNGRLKNFGLKTAIIRARTGNIFILLVETDKEDEAQNYLKIEQAKILTWLDRDDDVNHLERCLLGSNDNEVCPICNLGSLQKSLNYTAPPPGETDFQIPLNKYLREFKKCSTCGHFVAKLSSELTLQYSGQYADLTYGEELKTKFAKINALEPDKSDNYHRVSRVVNFLNATLKNSDRSLRVLDIGSGLCVFLYKLYEKTKWVCVAMDPDPMQYAHAAELTGIQAVHADFMKSEIKMESFHLITLNKVLEHVSDPIDMLKRTKKILRPEGIVYFEVPDGEEAIKAGQDREEFFIDHLHVFSFESACQLARKAGFEILRAERVIEPSSKFTICLFARPVEGPFV